MLISSSFLSSFQIGVNCKNGRDLGTSEDIFLVYHVCPLL